VHFKLEFGNKKRREQMSKGKSKADIERRLKNRKREKENRREIHHKKMKDKGGFRKH